MDYETLELVSDDNSLRLVPVSHAYDGAVFENFTENITTYMVPAPAKEIAETRRVVETFIRQRREGTDLVFAILNRESGEFYGLCGLHHMDAKTPELGIWTKAGAHGNHVGRRAIWTLYAWGKKHLSYDYIKYPVDRKNVPSRKIPESLGGAVEDEYKVPNMAGAMLDIVEYRLYPEKSEN